MSTTVEKMDAVYYGFAPGDYVIARISIDGVMCYTMSRDMVPRPVPADGAWRKIEANPTEGVMVPSTHHLPGTLYVKNNVLAFQDTSQLFHVSKGEEVTAEGTYQWYFDDLFPPSVDACKRVKPLLPLHMRNLFKNTKTDHLAYSGTVRIISFTNVPTIPTKTPEDALITFALSHLVWKKTGKPLLPGIPEVKGEGDTIEVTDPVTTWKNVYAGYASYMNVSPKSIVKRQVEVDNALYAMKLKELDDILEELSLTRTIVANCVPDPTHVGIGTLLSCKLKLKKLNRRMASSLWLS